jgi:hypothetical protein
MTKSIHWKLLCYLKIVSARSLGITGLPQMGVDNCGTRLTRRSGWVATRASPWQQIGRRSEAS